MFGASPAGAGAACPRLSFLDDATQRGWEAMFRDAAGGFGPGRAMSGGRGSSLRPGFALTEAWISITLSHVLFATRLLFI